MKDVTELTKRLTETFDELKSGAITVEVAGELNNGAGKIIKARTSQLTYFELRKEFPTIAFWDEPKGR